jgi:uncharacterized PurR-regulated membrane protein YhhQ (DUF165 family)
MSNKVFYISVAIFAFLIIASNYTVQFSINEWLTYGAVVYPVTFLLTDVLGENYSKQEVLKVVLWGIVIAIIPTIMIADWRIALGSITAFVISQTLDVTIFHYIKKRAERLWWLRNNVSTIVSQAFDTIIFFTVAFAWVLPAGAIVKMIIGDYMVKIVMALLDTPFFYLIAIKFRSVFTQKAS